MAAEGLAEQEQRRGRIARSRMILVILVAGSTGVFAQQSRPGEGPSGTGSTEASTQGSVPAGHQVSFPPSLESYGDAGMQDLIGILENRVRKQPFNLVATIIFIAAIIHTFLTHRFRHKAHTLQERGRIAEGGGDSRRAARAKMFARVYHFLGEVEVVFGIWVIPLLVAMQFFIGESGMRAYVSGVNFTEAVFVVVIMSMASTRPVLRLAEDALRFLARLGKDTPVAWWLALLVIGPLLGSFITEPAAMTICALLLSRKFYSLNPGTRLGYATLGLLFVAVSVGGTMTHFAAPPVLMVAGPWGWDTPFMFRNFGWKAAIGILISAAIYLVYFRKELLALKTHVREADAGEPAIPGWVKVAHVLFMVFAVIYAHNPPFLIFGMMVFLAFLHVTEEFQKDFKLAPPVLVGFFLAGLVVHGTLQQWWIEPVLGRLGEIPLMLTAAGLTAFNDNAAITYLCTLVPTLTDGMKFAAVAGAMAGGGLTVIANAPNPAGQSILNRHFEDGISPLGLLAGAAVPTVVVGLCYLLLPR